MSILKSITSGKRSQGKLEQFFAKAIPALSVQNSAHLGSRSSFDTNGNFTGYFGASDHCPRKSVLSRLHPVEFTMETQLRFACGHMIQELFSRLFKAGGLVFQEEVEIVHPDYPQIRCHIDFLFKGKNGRWHVVEKKATDGIPDEPYSPWVEQLQFQMGMLKRFYPDYKEGNIIGGSILASKPLAKEDPRKFLNGVREFNSFVPNDLVFEAELKKKLHMIDAVERKCDPRCEPGFLCAGYCPYYVDCPAHRLQLQSLPVEVVTVAATYAKLLEQKRQLEREIKAKKEQLLGFTGNSFQAESAGLRIKSYTTRDGFTVDTDTLKRKFPEVYKEVAKAKSGSQRLDIDVIDQLSLTDTLGFNPVDMSEPAILQNYI